jgi:hypothetical protein
MPFLKEDSQPFLQTLDYPEKVARTSTLAYFVTLTEKTRLTTSTPDGRSCHRKPNCELQFLKVCKLKCCLIIAVNNRIKYI